jgi:methylenetetrahydrofolate dehydrogenase (NADP+) / methenyltetrahydrofolate cyclohydrolase
MQLIDGKLIAEEICKDISSKLKTLDRKPKLSIILASNDSASLMYDQMKIKRATELGIDAELIRFDEGCDSDLVIAKIAELNSDSNVDGIMVQLPLFSHLVKDQTTILNSIDSRKDIDGLTSETLGKVMQGTDTIYPATVDAILECIKFAVSNRLNALEGQNVVIINNSTLIGKPLASLLSGYMATITIANEYTTNLKELCLKSEMIITATGQTDLIDESFIKENAIIIDVTSVKVDDKIKGDVIVSEGLKAKVGFLTPVPGGVGPLTVACLLRNLLRIKELKN